MWRRVLLLEGRIDSDVALVGFGVLALSLRSTIVTLALFAFVILVVFVVVVFVVVIVLLALVAARCRSTSVQVASVLRVTCGHVCSLWSRGTARGRRHCRRDGG